jgi:hypothetical protein
LDHPLGPPAGKFGANTQNLHEVPGIVIGAINAPRNRQRRTREAIVQ